MSVQALRQFIIVVASVAFAFFVIFQSQEALGEEDDPRAHRFVSYDDCIAQGGTHEFCISLIYPGDPPTPTWTPTATPTTPADTPTPTPADTPTPTPADTPHLRPRTRPHLHAHTYGHAHTYAHTYTHGHADSQADTHADPDTHAYSHADSHAHGHPNPHSHADPDAHSRADPDNHTHGYPNAHAYPDAYTHAATYASSSSAAASGLDGPSWQGHGDARIVEWACGRRLVPIAETGERRRVEGCVQRREHFAARLGGLPLRPVVPIPSAWVRRRHYLFRRGSLQP